MFNLKQLLVIGLLLIQLPAWADPQLYGRVRLGVFVTGEQNTPTTVDLKDVTSRFGIRGSEELEQAVEAIYRYEFGVNADRGSIHTGDRQRIAYVGIKGNFGQLIVGTDEAVADDVSRYIDPSEDIGDVINPFSTRIDNLIQYTYSNQNWKIGFGAKIDGEDRASDTFDAYNVAVTYSNQGFKVGIYHEYLAERDALIENDEVIEVGRDAVKRLGVGIRQKLEPFSVAALYVTEDDGSQDDYSGYGIGFKYNYSDKLLFAIDYQSSQDDDDTKVQAGNYLLVSQYRLSARIKLFVEYLNTNFSSAQQNDTDQFLFGLRHDFEVGSI